MGATPQPTSQPTPQPTPQPTKAPAEASSSSSWSAPLSTTKAPTTKAPTTKEPTTKAPTTKAPTTKAPTNMPTSTAISAAPAKLSTTISGPAISAADLEKQAVLKYGAGAKVKEYKQTSKLSLEGMPGSVADYSSNTALGQAKRYTVKKGATVPLSLPVSACAINGVTSIASGRRQLRAGGVSVAVAIESATDVSATVGGNGFLSQFKIQFKKAVDTVPASIVLSAAEKNTMAAQKSANLASMTKSAPVYETKIVIEVPAASFTGAAFDTSAVTALLAAAGVNTASLTFVVAPKSVVTTAAPTAAPAKKESSGGAGAIIGIVCAVVVVAGIVGAFLFIKSNRRTNKVSAMYSSSEPDKGEP